MERVSLGASLLPAYSRWPLEIRRLPHRLGVHLRFPLIILKIISRELGRNLELPARERNHKLSWETYSNLLSPACVVTAKITNKISRDAFILASTRTLSKND